MPTFPIGMIPIVDRVHNYLAPHISLLYYAQESNSSTGYDVQDTEEALIQAALEISKNSVKLSAAEKPKPE